MVNPTHFDLHSLRVFLAVAETGSLTRAAERCHMTLSAISKRIADLERATDCALLVRHPRGVELTPAGHGLLNHALQVLDQVNRMASEMSDFAVGVRGHVRVWANTSAVVQFLPTDLQRFLAVNPSIRITLEERLSSEVIEALGAGRTDLGIFADNVPAPLVDKRLYRRDQLVLLVPAGHALAGLTQIAFADTLDYDYVGLNSGSSLLLRLMDAALAAERPLRLRVQVSSFDGISRMIEAGLGIGILPAAAVRPEILEAGLRAVQLTDAWAERTLWIAAKQADALTPEAARLFEFMTGTPEAQ
ncbi:MAG: LysR family transcriptional regulator [Paraburkholderia sp.]|jgi:DNA-binding transcriptional LysR family regulator|uniref:LysR family transcriptional regulator n=1 Tax=Burkholderiaceae TaxID=119060 RepID=UPI0010F6DDE3|nr:LysR family transcriptional regulator [Burkholderia sp. 4M9327F10]